MKNRNKVVKALMMVLAISTMLSGCVVSDSKKDQMSTLELGDKLAANQPTPTDIEYSLERYNLIRREYWVSGMEEKATSLPCPVDKPMGYIALILEGVGVIDTFVVDGKVSSMNSYLTPDSEYYGGGSSTLINWLPDVDGTFGDNDNGIFFFTVDGHYIEWSGHYLYSDTPIHVDETVVKVDVEK
jgi:hypothetical protein